MAYNTYPTNFWYYATSDTTVEAKLLDARALATAAEQAMENSPGVDGSGDGNDGMTEMDG